MQRVFSEQLFAFDAGQELSEHTAPFDALVQVIQVEVEITVSSKPNITKAEEIILLPANQSHALMAPKLFAAAPTV